MPAKQYKIKKLFDLYLEYTVFINEKPCMHRSALVQSEGRAKYKK